MKRFFTFIMAAFVAITTFATPHEATTQNKAAATKMLLQREALITNMAAHKQDVAAVSTQTNTLDTTELVFRSFYQDPVYIPEEKIASRNGDTIVVGGDWLITLKNDRYQFNFDFYGGTPESPAGTYTVEDMEIDFSSCFHPAAPNKTSYYKTCNLTIQEEKVSAHKTMYILDAEIVATLGIGGEVNGIFKIHAEHTIVTASQRYDVALYNCVVTPESDRFNITGQDDTVAVDMTFFTDLGVVGYYSHNLLDTENANITHRGTSYEVIELDGIVTSAENIYGSVTYVAMMEVLAKSDNDTTFFNIAMEAPVVPTDTVDIFCSNLMMSASMDAVVIEASNSDYSIYAGYNDFIIRDSASYSGINAMVYITELQTEKVIGAMVSKIDVVGSKAKGYLVTAKVVGDDHKYYNITLTNVLPENMDTVNVHFPANSKAAFDIDELGLYELYLANYNGDYSVSFDILNINQVMGSELTKDDLFIDKTEVTTYFVKHTDDGDVAVDFVHFNGEIFQENDSTFLNATLVGFDSTVYNISMYYTVPTPTDTVYIDFPEYNTELTNALPQGIFVLKSLTEDGSIMCNVHVNRNYTGSVEGTFICDGKFEETQYEPFETYVATYNAETQQYVPSYMQKGEMTVTMDDNNMITAKATFICDDAKLYIMTMTAQFERPRLQYDAEDEGAEYTYGANTIVETTDWVESDGLIYYDIYAADGFNMTSLVFFIEEKDADIIIPEGVYPINSSWNAGTVLASRGLGSEDGLPLPSYYAEFDEAGYVADNRGFFLVDGTVTVEKVNGHIVMTVDAVNSYDLPVKLLYDPSLTPVENVESNSAATIQKQLINGQLYIIRNGETYNANGALVK